MATDMTLNDDDDGEWDRDDDDSYSDNTDFDPSSFDSTPTGAGNNTTPTNQNTPSPSSIPIAPPPPQPTVRPLPHPLPKDIDAQNARALQAMQADFRRQLKRDKEDVVNAGLLEKRRDKSAATLRRTKIASDATTQRIQAYTIASSLGFAGYVMASLVDQHVIRPVEDKARAQETAYTDQYARYVHETKMERLDRIREGEDNIRNLTIDDLQSATYDSTVPPLTGPRNPRDGGGGGIAETANTVGTAIKPLIPTPIQNKIAPALGPIMAVTVGVDLLQKVNKKFEEIGDSIQQGTKNLISGTPTAGISTIAHGIKNATDPLGINVNTTLAVEGFDILLGLTDQLVAYARQNIEFSPQALIASVEGDNAKLLQAIRLGGQSDDQRAALLKMSNQLELTWNEFKHNMFVTLAPLATNILAALNKIAGNTEVNDEDANDFMQAIEDFLDPTNIKDFSPIVQKQLKGIK